MDISVIICTYNRAESLRRTLQTCCDLVIPEGVKWELIVVDNNSTDHTKQVCEKFPSRLPIRYLLQPTQGKSHALNLAVAESAGALLLFTDDDVNVPADWVQSYWRAQEQYRNVSFFAGRVVPVWEVSPPRWVEENWTSLLRSPFVSIDLGAEPHEIRDEGAGANLACRRNLFASGLKFREDVGPGAGGEVRGEDSELLGRATDLGFKGWYWPDAVTYHRTEPKRMTRQYIRQWFIGLGAMEARLGTTSRAHRWWGVPRYCWRQLLANAVRYGLTRWSGTTRRWLEAEIKMAKSWGMICECRRQTRQGRR